MSSLSGPPPLVILILCNGLSPIDLTSVLGQLKSSSKDIGSHSRREFFWTSYESIIANVSKFSNVDKDGGRLYGLIKFSKHANPSSNDEGEGITVFEEFTRNQRALVNAGASNVNTVLGRKIRPGIGEDDPAPSAKEYMMAWFDDQASTVYEDITSAEPCISIDPERGVYVGTRTKRKLCRGPPPLSATKSIGALVEFVSSLVPNAPLQSVEWHGHHPVSVKDYNVLLSGVWNAAILRNLPDTIGSVNSTSNDDIYAAFCERKNMHLISEAEILIDKMQTDIGKGLTNTAYFAGSMRDLAKARRNALLKKVYISAEKKKFIESVQSEGDVEEMYVVQKRCGAPGKFEDFGGIVFETFYKLDLDIY